MIKKLRDNLGLIQFIKFAFVGALNTLVDVAVFSILLFVFGVPKEVSQFFSYSAGILNSLIFNSKWTFKSDKKLDTKQILKFMAVNVPLMILSIIMLNYFGNLIHLSILGHALSQKQNYFVAKIIVTFVIVLSGFFGNKLWVFRNK